MSYNVKVYRKAGGEQLVVASGGSILMQTGGKILPNSGTQATHIANVTGAGAFGTDAASTRTKINSILSAMRGVGILATS